MSLIWRAFSAEVGRTEKLVLLYLAHRASIDGAGYWDRDHLDRTLRLPKRTLSRVLKRLRDSGLLEDCGPWYVLHFAHLAPPVDEPPQRPEPVSTNGSSIEAAKIDIDAEAIGEAVASRVYDVAEYMVDQLQNHEYRIGRQLDRLATFHVEQQPEREPEPDPVLESAIYKGLLELEIDQDVAYKLAEQRLGATASEKPLDERKPDPLVVEGKRYDDDAAGRLERVADIFEEAVTVDKVEAWNWLEAFENKNTVKGEVDAFELTYPAIVQAARERSGTMTLLAFLDRTAIDEGRAPWDIGPQMTAEERSLMELEIQSMLAEIAEINHPQCEVLPRIVEVGDDGVTRTEGLATYHRRVQAMHAQAKNLKQMTE